MASKFVPITFTATPEMRRDLLRLANERSTDDQRTSISQVVRDVLTLALDRGSREPNIHIDDTSDTMTPESVAS